MMTTVLDTKEGLPNTARSQDPISYAKSRLSTAKSQYRSKPTVGNQIAVDKWTNIVMRASQGEDVTELVKVKTYHKIVPTTASPHKLAVSRPCKLDAAVNGASPQSVEEENRLLRNSLQECQKELDICKKQLKILINASESSLREVNQAYVK